MQNLFTTQIGVPQTKRRKRGNASARHNAPPLTLTQITQAKAASNATDERRARLPNAVRKLCLRLAYEALDPEQLENSTAQMCKDIAEELEHLIKNGQTEQDRDTQRFIVEHGQEHYDCINQSEQKALQNARDLDATSEDEEEEDESGSDLEGFIVASDVESEEEQQTRPRIRIRVEDDEEQEQLCETFHEEDGTHLSEQD